MNAPLREGLRKFPASFFHASADFCALPNIKAAARRAGTRSVACASPPHMKPSLMRALTHGGGGGRWASCKKSVKGGADAGLPIAWPMSGEVDSHARRIALGRNDADTRSFAYDR